MNKIGSLNKITKTFALLEQEFEREPTPDEIAKELELSPEEIVKVMGSSFRYVSMDAPLTNDEDGSLYDVLIDLDSEHPDVALLNDSLKKEIERSLASLSKREADALRLYYGLAGNHPHTLEEVGQVLGLTRERVRQIKESAIKKLKMKSRSGILKSYLG